MIQSGMFAAGAALTIRWGMFAVGVAPMIRSAMSVVGAALMTLPRLVARPTIKPLPVAVAAALTIP
jgi:hypothetical protein